MRTKHTVTIAAADLLELLREKLAINGADVSMTVKIESQPGAFAIEALTIEYAIGQTAATRFSHYSDPGSFEQER